MATWLFVFFEKLPLGDVKWSWTMTTINHISANTKRIPRGWKITLREVCFWSEEGTEWQTALSATSNLSSRSSTFPQIATSRVSHKDKLIHHCTSRNVFINSFKYLKNLFTFFAARHIKSHHNRETMSIEIMSCKCLYYLRLEGTHLHHAGMYQPTVQHIRWVCLPL